MKRAPKTCQMRTPKRPEAMMVLRKVRIVWKGKVEWRELLMNATHTTFEQ